MPQLSVVVPVFNERDNIPPLLAEIAAALRGRIEFEIVYVDDDSSDDSVAVLAAEKARYPELRIVRHLARSGQSTAVWNGVRAAKSPWIATLDGDGQNDPADIPKLLAARDTAAANVRLFAGWRTTRRDSFNKRISSKIANAVRSRMLKDATPDTGCGLKLFEREVFLRLPYFDHMHRYLPALTKRAGFVSQSVPVGHRPRTAGTSKYGMLDRLWVGIADLRGVAWLMRRGKVTQVEEL
ncbi:glycosyltransferase [Dyella tabacisoli]|uniref:Glycosyltransferase n=1 Tax=Dyella tabacisoli TaxID=2282381 RepID=A0A369UME0_9GAMM|nr:glycosyltransferase [Dyella tabacisoli]RDD80878.1 glycosyltransferase [Dyella tabacisoli]